MISDWSQCCLDDVVVFETGHRNSQDAVKGGEYPFFICSKDVLGHSQFDFDKEAVIMAGNNADANFHLHYYKGRFAARQRTYVISPRQDRFHCRYFYYALHALQPYFKANAQGTTTKFVTIGILKNAPLTLPPPSEQKAIAHILGTIDDKIELNRKTSETLEGIAKALFKSWFVGFDPVRAKAEGRPTGLPDEISELFPDSFEESELGEIPSGWKATTISKLCEVVTKGTTPTSIGGSFSSSGIPFYKVESISDSGQIIPGKRAFISEEVNNMLARSQINKGDILFSIAGTIGRVALMGIKDVPANTNQALAIVRAKKNLVSPDFLYLYLRDKERIELARSKTVQSVQANFSLGELKKLPLVMPDDLSRSLFEEILAPIQKRIFLCHRDSLNLAVIRDTLLPRLISGELRVPDAEKMLEEAGV